MEIPEDLAPALKKALLRLSMGDMTAGEMMTYLTDPHRKATGFPEDVAERCTALLVGEGYLDDLRYLKLCLRHYDARAFGPRRIRQELVKHRFSQKYVEAALNRSIDWKARAVKALEKKVKTKQKDTTPAEYKKSIDFLVRLGYDYTTAKDAVSRLGGDEFFDGKDSI